ncbi:hypothetical protein WOLCODRAFT_135863 [Wolfiporia cocos MD-104 SS10]|uniref:RING-type E3 ubiquitin transferase n=1 Tax=Wolfiporia cocos (strain MD-104) TaxID=742152 RepID=A0A2H3JME6_WOLCO|nr:hypothetical protein WOLCODRAFT_135863 [Wolfiporia cocos MD-104 SS10]
MSSVTAAQTHNGGQKGRKNPRGRGGPRGDRPAAVQNPASPPAKIPVSEPVQAAESTDTKSDDGDICWICAEPVKYWSLSECNHRTCHVCALRLRALYKKLECTFCKEPQPTVIFTRSPDALWSSYTPDQIPYKDPKLSILFETQEMQEETIILLRFNCPDSECDYIANGWSDLKLHTRAVHNKLMCDLCIRHKKIFAHEHALYAPDQLPLHVPSMRRSHGHGSGLQQQIEGGVHPFCEFCRECFFSDDELYAHMREKHEECFVCKRNEVRDQYSFRNYDALEQHFMHAHFPCRQPACLARKFVVFGSVMDLKAHMVEEHGADMTARDKKLAMRIQAEFEFEETSANGRRGRRDRQEREREPPPAPVPAPPGPGSSRPDGAGRRRREAFAGNLTGEGANATPSLSQQVSRRPSPSDDAETGNAERNILVARITSLAPNPTTAIPAVQAAVRSYRVNESGARDLLSTVWNILDHNFDSTASIVSLLVDQIDDEDKKRGLLAAWNGFKVEHRAQFPNLVPTTTGSEWAGVTSGRVLNAKHSTSARSSTQSARQVWDRVARAAASSPSSSAGPPPQPPERFPVLQPSAPGPSSFRQPQRSTPWASSSAAASPAPVRVPKSVPGPGANARAAPTFSKSAFPELPSSSTARVPKAAIGGNKSLKRILGDSAPAVPAWGTGENGTETANGNSTSVAYEGEQGAAEPTSGKGKKGKGKQKQTLFTLGSFPT